MISGTCSFYINIYTFIYKWDEVIKLSFCYKVVVLRFGVKFRNMLLTIFWVDRYRFIRFFY